MSRPVDVLPLTLTSTSGLRVAGVLAAGPHLPPTSGRRPLTSAHRRRARAPFYSSEVTAQVYHTVNLLRSSFELQSKPARFPKQGLKGGGGRWGGFSCVPTTHGSDSCSRQTWFTFEVSSHSSRSVFLRSFYT